MVEMWKRETDHNLSSRPLTLNGHPHPLILLVLNM